LIIAIPAVRVRDAAIRRLGRDANIGRRRMDGARLQARGAPTFRLPTTRDGRARRRVAEQELS